MFPGLLRDIQLLKRVFALRPSVFSNSSSVHNDRMCKDINTLPARRLGRRRNTKFWTKYTSRQGPTILGKPGPPVIKASQ